jgi:hypothetical protein
MTLTNVHFVLDLVFVFLIWPLDVIDLYQYMQAICKGLTSVLGCFHWPTLQLVVQ